MIRGDTDVRVFEVQNQKILHIQTVADFNQFGYSFDNVASIPRAAIDLLFPDTTLVKLPAGALFRIGSDQKVYVISQDNKNTTLRTARSSPHTILTIARFGPSIWQRRTCTEPVHH